MAAAVVRDGREIVSSCVHGQDAVHRPYGGVVPELASRDHVRAVHQVVERALAEAQLRAEALDGIAVTAGPGLVGSLLVGLSFGKALAYRLGVPLVGVHHLSGHLASAELADPTLAPPYLGLVVSGGHTALYRIERDAPPALLGETRDDAVGEAFDKVAALLGLGFPGGPPSRARRRRGIRPHSRFRARSSTAAGTTSRTAGSRPPSQRWSSGAARSTSARAPTSLRRSSTRPWAYWSSARRRPRARAGSTASPSSAASPRTGGCAASSRPRANARASARCFRPPRCAPTTPR
jgi:hypothetical protein